MRPRDEIAIANQRHWEHELKGGFTVPWLDLETETVLQYANGQLEQVPETLFVIRPSGILANLSGKDVLCLASGGGQQSAVVSLLGARVTVVDLTEGQLEGDREKSGFSIELVEDLPFCPPDLQAPPGSWRHEAAYNFGLLVVARKG